jgi:DNA mismatch repair protein MutS
MEDCRTKITKGDIALYFRKQPPQGKIKEAIENAYTVENIQVLELSDLEAESLALLFLYIKEVVPGLQISWKKPRKEYLRKIMHMDETAIKTLELVQSQSGEKNSSLLAVLDHTVTAAGRRMLIDFILKPSLDSKEILERQQAISSCLHQKEFTENLKSKLRHVYDMERIISHLQNHPQVRHLGHVYMTLGIVFEIIDEMSNNAMIPEAFQKYWKKNNFPLELFEVLSQALFMENLPPLLDERRFVKPGFRPELDELIDLGGSAGDIILDFEKREKARFDIPSLKVRYNKVIGYYIEISKGQSVKAPENYSRRQTLVNAERFTCEELKKLEDKILGSRERIIDLQRAIFEDLAGKVLKKIESLRYWADACSFIDVIFSFTKAADDGRYVCPEISDDGSLFVKGSRHPVVESLFREEVFIPNDINLNNTDRHLAILTGPNMAGKSTYIRQVGLIQILAQMGSFVPADEARVSLADRIFTRIGAYDRLSRGESTFYVEMAECARIFQNFTPNSLILLDEIGRGTSTFDGISIARAMVEFLNDPANGRPKTLFATHYAELGGLIEAHKGIIGLTVSVLEDKDKIVFLRKIVEGLADKSYGIYVAQLAGIHPGIISRAKELLTELEDEGIWSKEPVFKEIEKPVKPAREKSVKDQLSMF